MTDSVGRVWNCSNGSTPPGKCPSCGSVAGYAEGPPCLTCHYEPSRVTPPDKGYRPTKPLPAEDYVEYAERDDPR